ncbi:MAG: SAM-dependent methyltransferase [Bacteroidales bacterium]|nr:SAM-dependent methyltransferase [Bacteroidales bacterium]
MDTYQIKPVGIVVNEFNLPTSHHIIKEKPSTIIIDDKYEEGLLNIDECEFLDIVFYFHRSKVSQELSGIIHSGTLRGVFASRSPKRPNSIGITTVKLLRREKNKLIVQGLDAIDETPVIDIKCCDTSLFASEFESNALHNAKLKSDPRIDIRNNILSERHDLLLLKAGQLHGHFCPGLAMGVMAASYAMREIRTESDGMEDLLAITETNNCFSDGVQFVTGCSFGNNALIFRDIGKTAFTLTRRDGKGIRICSKHKSRDIIQNAYPDYHEYYTKVVTEKNHDPQLTAEYKKIALKRAFGTLSIPFKKLFAVDHIRIEIPEYAPVYESLACSVCHESVMASRTIRQDNMNLCLDCAKTHSNILTGQGIITNSND